MTRGARHPPGTTHAHPGPAGGEQEGGRGEAWPCSPGERDGIRRGGQVRPAPGAPRVPLAPWDRGPPPHRSHPAAARGPPSLAWPGGVRRLCSLTASRSGLWDERGSGGFLGVVPPPTLGTAPSHPHPPGSNFGCFSPQGPMCERTGRGGLALGSHMGWFEAAGVCPVPAPILIQTSLILVPFQSIRNRFKLNANKPLETPPGSASAERQQRTGTGMQRAAKWDPCPSSPRPRAPEPRWRGGVLEGGTQHESFTPNHGDRFILDDRRKGICGALEPLWGWGHS